MSSHGLYSGNVRDLVIRDTVLEVEELADKLIRKDLFAGIVLQLRIIIKSVKVIKIVKSLESSLFLGDNCSANSVLT